MLEKVIIVAGGKGSRFSAELPKQFHLLAGRPVVMHTMEAFKNALPQCELILVLAESDHSLWKELCKKYQFSLPHQLTAGGTTRFASVKNGLVFVNAEDIVAVHDAVRPLIDGGIIQKSFELVKEKKAIIVAVPATESLRKKTNKGTEAVMRKEYWMVQTPQVFTGELLLKAYKQEYKESFTDDASVVEATGQDIEILEGNSRNIKITYPDDLLIAETLLQQKSPLS